MVASNKPTMDVSDYNSPSENRNGQNNTVFSQLDSLRSVVSQVAADKYTYTYKNT